MSQLEDIKRKKEVLEIRFKIIHAIREFFWEQDFLEVEAPAILDKPGQEPFLSPMKLVVHNENKKEFVSYLHTSPEYSIKKMLAVGFGNIFYLGKCFRDYESFGGIHSPEFTMLEWYRVGVDFYGLMDDLESLWKKISSDLNDNHKSLIINHSFQKIHMRDLWQEHVGVNLDEYLNSEKMFELCVDKGFKPAEDEPYEDLFYRIFLNEIEPKLRDQGAVIVHHYPAQMASLSKLSDEDPRYAERFEAYVNGIELANAFSELTDTDEQRKRLEEEFAMRKKLGKDLYGIDEDFVEAVGKLPKCAGISVGVDRLAQVLLGCEDINDVLVLPLSAINN